MSVLVLLLFFALIGIMVYGDTQSRFVTLVVGTVLFPTTALFTKNPSISPQHVFLYTFLFLEFIKDRESFTKGIFKNTLTVPLLLIAISYFLTAMVNSGIASKDMYYGIRDFVDSFGYILAAWICGRKMEIDDFAKRIIPFVIIICTLGIFEAMLDTNYPYKLVNSAFPTYEGLYDINGSVGLSQSWRTRTCLTTKHPTAFGTLLMSLFLFYLPYIRKSVIDKPKLYLTLALLGVNAVLCGSRTCLFCVLVGTALYIVDKFHILAKIATVGLIVFSFSAILAYMVENFGASGGKGQGSSLDFRARQLIFSYMAVQNSPIIGNGNKYTANYILEENDSGEKRAEDSSGEDMGGLESIVFTLLIDRGFVGLASYYFLLLWIFVAFMKYKKKYPEINGGFALIAAGTVYLTLSGVIGNSSNFLFLFTGIQLGCIRQLQEREEEEEDEKKLQERKRKITAERA